jgi:hypothetical protein
MKIDEDGGGLWWLWKLEELVRVEGKVCCGG